MTYPTIREIAFVPMCTQGKGSPWFALMYLRGYQRDARGAFLRGTCGSWEKAKRAGWRIVRVEVLS